MLGNLHSRAKTVLAGLWSDGRGTILTSVAGGWFLALGTRLAFPAVLPFVRAEFGITNTTAGSVITALWVSYALTQFPSGVLTDTLTERRILTLGIIVGGVSVLFIGLADGLTSFFIGTILFGLGTGLYATPRVTLISRTYPQRSTTALGVVFASGNLGSVILPAGVGVLAASFGWRTGFTLLGPGFALIAIALWLIIDPTRADDQTEQTVRDQLRALTGVLHRPVVLGTTTLMLFGFAYQGFVGFFVVYLVDMKGFAPATASVLYGLFFAVGLVIQLVAGVAADNYGRRSTLITLLALTVLGLFSLPFITGLLPLSGLVALLGVQLGYWPVINSYVYDALPEAISGSGYGLVRTTYLCTGATGPLLVGWLFDAGRENMAVMVLAGITTNGNHQSSYHPLPLWANIPD